MTKLIPIVLIFMFAMTEGCSSMTTKSSAVKHNETPTSITGMIAVKGSEPHTWVALNSINGIEYRLQGPLVQQLKNHFQNQSVTLKGKLVASAKGPGLPAVFEVEKIVE